MAFDPNLLPLAGFAALMVAAAVTDFVRLVIPNTVVAGLALLWLLHIETMRGTTPAATLETLACAAAVLIVGLLLFARGLIGGGDVKLLSVATLWAGAGALPSLLALTGLVGGVLALLFMTPLRSRLTAPRLDGAPDASAGFAGGGTPIPYGVAIAAAALVVTIPPYLG